MTAVIELPAQDRRLPWETLRSSKWITDINGTLDEVIEQAGLDWTVQHIPVTGIYRSVGNRRQTDIEFRKHRGAIRVNKNGTVNPLSVVGKGQTIVQNREMLEVMETIGQTTEATWASAGELRNGTGVFAFLRLDEGTTIAGEAMDWYLGAIQYHDGSGALRIAPTAIRPGCTNQFNSIFRHNEMSVRFNHTSGIMDRLAIAQHALRIVSKVQEDWSLWANQLADVTMHPQDFTGFLDTLVPVPAEELSKRAHTQALNTRDKIRDIYFGDTHTMDNLGFTKWRAFNAVSEYEDWFRPVRGGDSPEIARAARGIEKGNGPLTLKARDLLTAGV